MKFIFALLFISATFAETISIDEVDAQTADVPSLLTSLLLKVNSEKVNSKEVQGMLRLISELEKRLLSEGTKEKKEQDLYLEEYKLYANKIDAQNKADKARIAEIENEGKEQDTQVVQQMKLVADLRKMLKELSPETSQNVKLIDEDSNFLTIRAEQSTQEILNTIMVNLQRPHAEVAGIHELLNALEARLKSEKQNSTTGDSKLLADLNDAIEERASSLARKNLEKTRKTEIYSERNKMRANELAIIEKIKIRINEFLKVKQ